jgi:D-beta-D-heptose 7-phosphate kinase / D-beta-D-heptose 1-phosphate adenosyltransferase
MSNYKIIVAGDIILDRYIFGTTDRISPEAPVPIVKYQSEKYTLGGAGNVANNLQNLEISCQLLGVIGKDDNGKLVLDLLNSKNIISSIYECESIPTTSKTRLISRNQQIIRVDKEENFFHTSKSLVHMKNQLNECDIIVVSDYGKGYCSEDFFDMLFNCINDHTKVLVDPKGREWTKYNGSFLVKPNILELAEMCGKELKNEDDEIANAGRKIYGEYNFKHLIITRGKKGMTHIFEDRCIHYPTQEVDVYDVSGAGDTAMAVIADYLVNKYTVEEAILAANLASSYVVSKPMTYAISKAELLSLINKNS